MTGNGQTLLTLLLLTLTLTGCATGPITFVGNDSQCGPDPGSADWWAQQAQLPPGDRQKCWKGKNWPVQPRSTLPPQQFTHVYHSAHYWPLPYVCQDRAYTANIINTQVRNGWQQETTLYDRHFELSQSLNVPGQLHLEDILTVTPPSHRTIYVQSTRNAELDNARLANVQQLVADMTGGTETVPVVMRQARDYSRPASEVKIINDLYNTSVPTPRLGSAAGGGSSSGTAAATPQTGP